MVLVIARKKSTSCNTIVISLGSGYLCYKAREALRLLRPFKFASSIIIECIHTNVHCQCTMSSAGSKGSLAIGLTYENMLPPIQCAGHLLTHLLLLSARTGMAMC